MLPDLILIDGGKGQLSAAVKALREAGLTRVPVFGLAKRNEELYKPGRARPIIIERDSPTLFLVQRVRDEAHRFAITRHRARRGRAALRSKLDVVPGLGPVRRRALLRHFGSIDAIRDAPARAAHHGGAAAGGAARQGAAVSDGEAAVPVAVTVTSFGFKFGLPPDAGWIVDARMVRNPFWVAELRSYTGLDAPVRDYVLEDPVAGELIDRMHALLLWSSQRYAERGRDVLSLAVGCTGGRHRSVAIVEALAERLRADGLTVTVTHRDVDVPDPPALSARALDHGPRTVLHPAGRRRARPAHAAPRRAAGDRSSRASRS